MAKREKISEERRKLIQEFIKSNDLKTTGDIQEAIKDLFKDTIQEMLNAELTEHLGYEKNEYIENNENYRNGYSPKTVHSTEGDITLNVPRDRQGTFDPIIVEKGQKDISSIEEKIIRMYARGMSNQNIYEEMQDRAYNAGMNVIGYTFRNKTAAAGRQASPSLRMIPPNRCSEEP